MNWWARFFRNFFCKHPDVYIKETVTTAPTGTDRELLVTDLCQRLPYKVICYAPDNEYGETGILYSVDPFDETDPNIYIQYPKGNILSFFPSEINPYLRPMSDVTPEEREELDSIIITIINEDYTQSVRYTEYLNRHHLDWRGLIPKGLALAAPEWMYNN